MLQEESKPSHDWPLTNKVKRWSLMENFFSHSWFTRVWTLQEIALHCFDPIFFYGDETITLSVITQAMSAMFHRGFDHASIIQEALESHLVLRSKVQEWRASWNRDDRGMDLLITLTGNGNKNSQLREILTMSRRMKATCAVDNIYGIYGICEWLDIYQPPPRYELSFEEAAIRVTCAAIQGGFEGKENLAVLYDASESSSNRKLPSWVPDWSHGSRRLYGVPGWSMQDFSAGGPRPLCSIDYEEKLLKVKGRIIDEIEALGSCVEMNESISFFANLPSGDDWIMYEGVADDCWATWKVYCGWASLVRNISSRPGFMDEFMSTILGNSLTSAKTKFRGADTVLEPQKTKQAFRRWYEALLATNTGLGKENEQEWRDTMNRVYYARYMFGDGTDHELRLVYFNVWSFTRGKSLFITRAGRIGLGMGEFRRGQELAVVGGLEMPLVLMNVGKGYRLCGYSYLHGVMEGQAWQNDARELQTIRIE